MFLGKFTIFLWAPLESAVPVAGPGADQLSIPASACPETPGPASVRGGETWYAADGGVKDPENHKNQMLNHKIRILNMEYMYIYIYIYIYTYTYIYI